MRATDQALTRAEQDRRDRDSELIDGASIEDWLSRFAPTCCNPPPRPPTSKPRPSTGGPRPPPRNIPHMPRIEREANPCTGRGGRLAGSGRRLAGENLWVGSDVVWGPAAPGAGRRG